MAPSALNGGGDAISGIGEVDKVPEGIILPPKDIRAIVEKTAGYVARNGPVFEDRIRDKEKQNPKFSFLNQEDAYSLFYLWRLSEIREGRGTAVSAGRVGEAAPAEPEKPKGPEQPPDFQFSARMPNISAQDLEVVKLTALFVAANGRSFMTTLLQRETGNYQFDFLRPNHSMYQFFSRLVDQYTELLRAGGVDGEGNKVERQRIKELEENVKDRYHVLGRAKQRAEWLKYQEEQKQKKEEEAEQEKLAYAQIDWHDFVVVETVLFNEVDDNANLPPPTSLSDLQSASLEQKAMMSLQPHDMRIEEAMPGEDTYYNPYDTSGQQAQAMPPPAAPIYSPQLQPPPVQRQEDTQVTSSTEEEDAIRERTQARERAQQAQAEALAAAKGGATPMKIRSDYVPRAALNAQNKRSDQMAVCPNCKQKIPYNELDEHMRIELLDPRWKSQRAAYLSRTSTTNLSTADVANNLKRLASQRSDLFDGVTGQPISEEEAARRKKAAMAFDGNPEGRPGIPGGAASGQNVDVSEQIKAIHQRYGGGK